MGCIALDRGDLALAEVLLRRGLAVLEEIQHQGGVAACWGSLGWVAGERGDLEVAAQWCRRARRHCQSNADPHGAARAILIHVTVLLRRLSSSRLRAADLLLGRGRTLIIAPGWDRLGGRAAVLEGRVALSRAALAGEPELWVQAQAAAQTALRVAEASGLRPEEALALGQLGQCALAQGRDATAEGYLRSALVLQEEMGTALEAGRTRRLLAQALAACRETVGILDEARGQLAAAREQFAASGAAWDLAQAEQLAGAWGAG
jgi:hypothetical protein